jgi:hypothetical protein
MSTVTIRDVAIVLAAAALVVLAMVVMVTFAWLTRSSKVGELRRGLEHLQTQTERRDRDVKELTAP